MMPFFANDIRMSGPMSISRSPLLALKAAPLALTVGKYLVKASLRSCRAASTLLAALRTVTLFRSAISRHSSNV